MLLIETFLDKTKDKGIGLFAKNKILKDTIIWVENELFDRKLTKEQVILLPQIVKNWILEYSPFDGYYHYIDLDFMKHSNHSWDANIKFTGDKAIATRDIKKNEELTTNYSEFDIEFREGNYNFDII